MGCWIGFCVYPHGGTVSAFLWLAAAAAIAATAYGVASCRLLVVTYTSTEGCFVDYFDINGNAVVANTGERELCQTAVGLFQWLEPNPGATEWFNGRCVGYQETMLAVISNTFFEASRVFGVFAVLLAVVVALWSFSLACLQLNKCQRMLFRFVCLLGLLSCTMTFLMIQAPVCTTLFEAQECALDQGGLVMIAACLLWVVIFVLSAVFLKWGEFDRDHIIAMKEKEIAQKKKEHKSYRTTPASRSKQVGDSKQKAAKESPSSSLAQTKSRESSKKSGSRESINKATAKSQSRSIPPAKTKAERPSAVYTQPPALQQQQHLQPPGFPEEVVVVAPVPSAKTRADRPSPNGYSQPSSKAQQQQHLRPHTSDEILQDLEREDQSRACRKQQAPSARPKQPEQSVPGKSSLDDEPPKGTCFPRRKQQQVTTQSPRRKTYVTVDDVTNRDQMEVFFSKRLDKLERAEA